MLHLTLNQRVAIARHGNRGPMDEGVYVVQKLNKVKAILSRESDGHIRTFSVKTCKELGEWCSPSTYLRSVEERERDLAERANRDTLNAAWLSVQEAAKRKDIANLRVLVAELEKLL